jgi:hypothetical protein
MKEEHSLISPTPTKVVLANDMSIDTLHFRMVCNRHAGTNNVILLQLYRMIPVYHY